ncbi:MAG TPA: SH3 domain-containing protein [Planctomycetota bacterium]|nr:SH3 domain-containing protein [Planctomycetota bacterium]
MSTFARRSWSWSLVLSLGLGLAVSAQETPKSGESRSSADAAEFPFEGEVTCENLNVRLAPRTDAATGVVAVLRQGDKVIALGASGEFLVVKAPRGATAWIYGKHIKKEADASGTVLVNDAPLRTDSRAGAEKIGALKEGERVSIVKEHLGWYQVSAPSGVKYYVSKKFVRFLGAAEGIPLAEKTAAPIIEEKAGLSDAAAQAKMNEAQALIDEQSRIIEAGKLNDLDYSGVVAAYESAVGLAKTDGVKRQAETKLESSRGFNNMLIALKGNLKAIEELLALRKNANEEKYAKDQSKYEACGYVDTVGPLFYRPGAFKLMMSGKIVAFIKVPDGDEDKRLLMNRMYGKYVGVTGAVLKDPPGWIDHKVVTLETVEELIKK